MANNQRCLRQPLAPIKLLMPALLALIALVSVTAGCSSQAAPAEEPTKVATQFISAYDEWAQNGFQEPIPESLQSLATGEMVEVLESDQRWHANGGVVQHGEVRVVGTTVLELSEQSAIVRIQVDARDVSVTAQGKPTYVDYSKPIITDFTLEKTAEEWRVKSTSSDS